MANNSTFRNNITAVQFERYTHTLSISHFKNCTFETEGTGLPSYYKKYFVRLNEIGGLFFGGCTFKNTLGLSSTNSLTQHGIYSVNSYFVVDRQCPTTPCPEGDEYKSKFENMIYGIYATSNTGTKSFKVNNSIFNNNDCGIYALNINNIDVRFNHFKVTKVGEKKTGLYLDYSTDFVIEENEFEYALSDNPEMGTRGMVVNNSGDLDNHIYKNTFKNLEYGICSQDINRNKDGSRGLRIKCNNFTQTKFDIAITRSQIISGYGIAYAQGSAEDSTRPAGNLFSNLPTNTGYYGILNNCERIEYTHHDPTGNSRVRPSNYSQFNVYLINSRQPYSPACCPSNVSGGGGTIDQQLLAEKEMADSIQSELSQLIDDGNTEVKLFTINTSLPDENIEIHNDLLNTSPFVSDTVIQTVITREEIFNNAMVRNLMVANPHTAKSEVILQGLNNRLEPMPDYLMDEILEAIDTLSIKELMEIKMQIGQSNYTYGLNRLLSRVLSDTIFSTDSIFNILNLDNSFHSQMKKAWFELEDGDTIKALNTLDSMNVSNQLTNSQSLELSEQSDFMEWLVDNQIIDSTKSDALNYFLSSPSAYVSSCARVLMISNNLMQYSEPYLVPDLTKNAEVKKEKQNNHLTSERYIKVYPNPTRDFVTVEYKLKQAGVKSSIRIIDENGKLIKSLSLSKQRDQLIVDTRNLKAGNYFVQLISGTKELSSARFIIIY